MKVLIADDDSVSRRLLESTLTRWGYEVVATKDGNEAWDYLQHQGAPQLAIIDWMMPGMEGVELCRRVRALDDMPYTYFLLLTSRDSKTDLVTGMEAGADDYIVKPFDTHELRVRLRAGQRIVDLQTALLAAQETLRQQANTDPLTGVPNRFMVLKTLSRELNRASREGTALAVVMSDIDHFKRVNDTYGHVSGDAVLQEVARRVQTALRSYDVVGRYGGEEFLILLPGCNMDRAFVVSERIRTSVCGSPVVILEASLTMTMSLGIAVVNGPPYLEAEAVIDAADTALYRAKGRGGNLVERATAEASPCGDEPSQSA